MHVSSLTKLGPVKAITIDTPKPMSDTIHSIRHKNAKHILNKHCNGVTKDFAAVLGKAEQQCSNFLRDNAPVKIGPRIAREIEFAFGYSDKWLDVEHSADEIESVDPGLVDHLNSINRALKSISSLLFDGVSVEDAATLNNSLSSITDKSERLRREARDSLLTKVVDHAKRMLSRCGFLKIERLKEPLFFENGPLLKSGDTLFEIVLHNELPVEQRTLYHFENAVQEMAASYHPGWGCGKSSAIHQITKDKAGEVPGIGGFKAHYWLVPMFQDKKVEFVVIDRLAVYLYESYGPTFDSDAAAPLAELADVLKTEYVIAALLCADREMGKEDLAYPHAKRRINNHPKFEMAEKLPQSEMP